MMGLGYIQELQRKAEREARRRGLKPLVIQEGDTLESIAQRGGIPFIGELVPKGWRRTETPEFFVDTSGLGAEDEPALTVTQFLAKTTPGKGYALTQVGQFQGYVAEFERV